MRTRITCCALALCLLGAAVTAAGSGLSLFLRRAERDGTITPAIK